MSEHQNWDLVMPFVVTESHGGPYEDQAFVAGFALGGIDATLERLAEDRRPGLLPHLRQAAWWGPVRTASLPQLDLIAMRHGYSVETLESDEEWTSVRIRLTEVRA